MLVTGDRRGHKQIAAATIAGKIKRARQTGVLHLAGMGLTLLPREAVHLHEQVRGSHEVGEPCRAHQPGATARAGRKMVGVCRRDEA